MPISDAHIHFGDTRSLGERPWAARQESRVNELGGIWHEMDDDRDSGDKAGAGRRDRECANIIDTHRLGRVERSLRGM
ncbi:hypothetical protein [Mycolicibacterium sp. 624]|uniref:hypothetical protein n=1 Tax=Mycolicibacterium sp. 624 TaxID=3156314 RepID=UPI00339342AB